MHPVVPCVQKLTFESVSAAKQEERQKTLDGLSSSFFEPCTESDNKVLDLSLSELVQRHNAGSLSTASILNAYGKKVVSAQKATNCLAGIMIQEALVPKVSAPSTGSDGTDIPEQPAKLLSGVPVSIKDYRYPRLRHYCWLFF